ncbi:MAG TPA: hypothetical protein VK644_10050 [Chitinophagaceae bacterium]|nr:hypothetical protein [Chitinophagaceae bacterium]
MNLFKLMGLISTVALALPPILIILLRLVRYRSFPALLAYYILICSNTILLLGYFDLGNGTAVNLRNLITLSATPAILLFLTYFSRTPSLKRKLLISIACFVGFELIMLTIFGLSDNTMRIVQGPGILLTLFFSLSFFIHQVKITVVYHKAAGKALMVASLLFACVGYGYVYVVNTILNTPFKEDANLILFLVSIFSSLTMAFGLFFEQKRVRQLEELQTTRQELKSIYGEQDKKKTTSFETIVFNYDKKQWN